jgi:hypothetical protein
MQIVNVLLQTNNKQEQQQKQQQKPAYLQNI